ncbi:MAG: PQQ-binding-like beta-propeller repeat protein [Bacteroidales bacterium]|nr:PQQ-binding-like beta-propeller repeat protein [Bacteroidales bacterium]
MIAAKSWVDKVLGVLFLIILCSGNLRAQSFRFAQLTDVHLNHNAPQKKEDLLRCIACINATDSLDFVLITGDITDEGDAGTMQMAKDCFDLLQVPYYIVSGNHETKWSESGCTAFAALFGSERFGFVHKGVRFLGFNTGPLMRMAYGHVAPQDILWLKDSLDSNKHIPTIIVTHYPLLPNDVDNWYQVTELLSQYNVRLCIGGHYHRYRNLSYDGIPGILMRSSYRDKEGRTGYGIYEVSKDSISVFVQQEGEPLMRLTSYAMTGDIVDVNGHCMGKDEVLIQYPDYSDNRIYRQVKETWLNSTGVGIYCSPACDKKRVYVGDDLGNLTAYSLNKGAQLWCFKGGSRIVGNPDVAGSIVVFGTSEGKIFGLKAIDGTCLWTVKAQAAVLGGVTIRDHIAYVGASDGCMRAIEIETGNILWCYDKVKGYIETKPLVTDSHIVFGAWDNTLYALQKQSGDVQWQWTGNIRGMHYSPAAVWPVESDGKVFIADPQRALTAIDAQTGTTVWRTKQSMVRETIGLSKDGKRIYSKTMNDSVVCYATQGNIPLELWATDVGFGYEHAPSMLQEKDDVVYGSTKEGMIFALDAVSGRLLWRHKVGNALVHTVVPIGGNKILFTTTGGEVGLLTTSKQKYYSRK